MLFLLALAGLQYRRFWNLYGLEDGRLVPRLTADSFADCRSTPVPAKTMPATPVDEVFGRLVDRFWNLDRWEFAFSIEEKPTSQFRLDNYRIPHALAYTDGLRRTVLAEVKPEFEPPGSNAVLTPVLNHKGFRTIQYALADSILCLLARGETEEALALIGRVMEMTRLVGRGYQKGKELPSALTDKFFEIEVLLRLDTLVAVALQQHRVPLSYLDRLDALYLDQIRRETDLDALAESDFEVLEQLVKRVNERMPRMDRWCARYYWGDGLAQVRFARKAYPLRVSDPKYLFPRDRSHWVIAEYMPRWPLVREAFERAVSMHHGIRVAIALERQRFLTGSYPSTAPADLKDPFTSKPFLFEQRGDVTVLRSREYLGAEVWN